MTIEKNYLLKSKKKRKGLDSESVTGYLLIAPTIVTFIIFLYIPFFNALQTSFYKYNGIGALTNFVGFNNYIKVLTDVKFMKSLFNTFELILAGFVGIPIGFILAYILYQGVVGKKFFSAALFVPYLISMVVVGCIWKIIYDPTIGPLNQILEGVGLGNFAVAWLSRPTTAIWAIAVVWIWRSTPFNMLIIYANIMKMPNDFLEAAEIDGANLWQKLVYIIIPYLKPSFLVLGMLNITNSLRLFDLIWVMTKGGPGGASDVMTSYIYTKAFTNLDFGLGTAASVVLMVIMMGIMMIKSAAQGLVKRREKA
ncbi:MAG: sugar ABC transporter permease [Candidatus Galacturonibacter soehngenii]|nr:sugar ABC transporter permease [Candidatus Galacturonibacter soehngenii]